MDEEQEERCDCFLCKAEISDDVAERLEEAWGDTSTDRPWSRATYADDLIERIKAANSVGEPMTAEQFMDWLRKNT